MTELHSSDIETSHPSRASISEHALATFRDILNTQRDHLISATHVNDTLIAELISSGVISPESNFTHNDVRRKYLYMNHFYSIIHSSFLFVNFVKASPIEKSR
jgi:hypothetical protein